MKKCNFREFYPLFILFLIVILPISTYANRAYFSGGLEEVIADSNPSDQIQVVVGLDGTLDTDELRESVLHLNLIERRSTVIRLLKENLEITSQKPLRWIRNEISSGRAELVSELWIANALVIKIQADRIDALTNVRGIDRVHFDREYTFEEMVQDEHLQAEELDNSDLQLDDVSWAVEDVGVTELWAQGYYGQGKIVGVMDTGADMDHPDLIGQFWTNLREIPDNDIDDDNNGYVDDINGWNYTQQTGNLEDSQGHGTKCAGVLVGNGASNDDTTGIVVQAKLMVVRNYPADATPFSTWANALQYMVEMGADVISTSMTFTLNTSPDQVSLRTAEANTLAAGVIHANSTGNSATSIGNVPNNIATPGNCPPPWLHPEQTLQGGNTAIIGVGSHTSSRVVASNSGLGPAAWENVIYPAEFQDYPYDEGNSMGLVKPDILAPTIIPTTTRGGGHTSSFNGTSASTPVVAGILTLLRSIHQQATPEELTEAIFMSAEDGGPDGLDNRYGSGMIRANMAHEYLDNMFEYGSLTVNVTTSTGDDLDEVFVSLDDGVVDGLLAASGDMFERVLPGTYTLKVKAAGYNEYSEANVTITSDQLTTVDIVLDVFVPPISPLMIDTQIANDADLNTTFVINNPDEISEYYNIQLLPRGGLNWENDNEINLAESFPGIELTAVTTFGDTILVAGYIESETPQFYLYDRTDLSVIGNVAQSDRFGDDGVQDLSSGDGAIFAAEGQMIFTLDNTLSIVDSFDVSENLSVVNCLIYNDDINLFYLNGNSGWVYVYDRDGNPTTQFSSSNDAPSGTIVHRDALEGRVFYSVVEDDGLLMLNRHSFVTSQHDFVHTFGNIEDFPAVSMDITQTSGSPYWNITILFADGRMSFYQREIPEDAYELVSHVDAIQGDTDVEFVLHGALLPSDRYLNADIVWTNWADIWEYVMPVNVEVGNDTSVDSGSNLLPEKIALLPAYPNPFNPSVNLSFTMNKAGLVKLHIYNILGQKVITLIDKNVSTGIHSINWNGSNNAAGMYLVVLETESVHDVQKILLLK
jgi:subtilisin family serine protease